MRQFVKKQLNEVSHGKNLATVITLALNKRTKSILFNRLFFQSQEKNLSDTNFVSEIKVSSGKIMRL